jgi:hypothetical protein
MSHAHAARVEAGTRGCGALRPMIVPRLSGKPYREVAPCAVYDPPTSSRNRDVLVDTGSRDVSGASGRGTENAVKKQSLPVPQCPRLRPQTALSAPLFVHPVENGAP